MEDRKIVVIREFILHFPNVKRSVNNVSDSIKILKQKFANRTESYITHPGITLELGEIQ